MPHCHYSRVILTRLFVYYLRLASIRMRSLCMFLYFIILVLAHNVLGLNSEGEALISLLNRTTIPNSINLSWNSSDSTPCQWLGIRCDHRQRVVSLNMSNYRISGKVGQEIGQLKFLETLDLSMNSFSGTIPSDLGNRSQLNLLDLSKNRFQGEIPENLKNLIHLRQFSVQNNALSGGIPEFLFSFPQLSLLSLGSNKFGGPLPSSVGNMTAVASLDVSSNRLEGMIPVEMTALHRLRNLSMYDNSFSGVIPQTFGINSSLEHLDFTNNNFSGEIPPSLCFQNQLKVLHLGQNQFLGNIPSEVGNCSALKRLILAQNNLTGPLPQFVENHNLSFLDLSRNNVNGSIPSSLGNCKNLTLINLSMNKLTGSIPQELGHLAELQKLDLSDNRLQGPLQPDLSKCIKLYSLNVGFNSLNGSIPSSLRTLIQLSTLVLKENQFSGRIPDFLAELEILVELQLGGNSLGGYIPPSLGKLKNLAYTLNLSRNRLTGQIPLQGLYSLLELNISYNSFTGTIPDALLMFLLKSPSSFLGNPDLKVPCTLGISAIVGHLSLSSCHTEPGDFRGLNRAKIILIAIGSSLLCIFMILVSSYMIARGRKVEELGYEFFLRVYPISLKDVMKATDDLNEKFIVGRGGHGTVYKAQFSTDHVVAVKKLVFSGRRGANISMRREIQTVGTIKHRNLVWLLDFWFQKDYGLIMYEYMPNGSLHDVLHEISPAPHIMWDVRYRIALGTAEGLAYLHDDCNPAIVHQDIKPNNILLDSDMEPHISDFGIAKLMDNSPASIRTITVIGTVGYIAPEIAFTMAKNKLTDVYSYGVVLLELITRKKVMDPSLPGEMNIVRWAHTTWSRNKKIHGIVDEGLLEEFMIPAIKKEMKKVFKIALQCTEKDPRKRPTIRNVVKKLKDAKARE